MNKFRDEKECDRGLILNPDLGIVDSNKVEIYFTKNTSQDLIDNLCKQCENFDNCEIKEKFENHTKTTL